MGMRRCNGACPFLGGFDPMVKGKDSAVVLALVAPADEGFGHLFNALPPQFPRPIRNG